MQPDERIEVRKGRFRKIATCRVDGHLFDKCGFARKLLNAKGAAERANLNGMASQA